MNLFKKVADNSSTMSLAHSMRYKRFNYFTKLIQGLNCPIRILDIGGTQQYWENMGFINPNVKIILLNLSMQPTTSPNFVSVVGNATDLKEFTDNSFDVVFSNSVIEHLYTKENQYKMANEVRRVGKHHFIQTPNYFFPIEPHFLFPGFQFLPINTRVFLVNKFNLGHIERKKDIEEARRQVNEIQLLKTSEMRKLFPASSIWEEKFGGLVKSIVAHNLG